MSWLEKLLPPAHQALDCAVAQEAVPEGLWIKCPSCDAVLYSRRPGDQPQRLPEVQPPHAHRRARAARRCCSTPKAASRSAQEVLPVDALKFKDSRKYPERLQEATAATGETDALVVMGGAIQTLPVVVACFEFDFMGGSMGSVVGERFVRGVQAALEQKVPFVCFTAIGRRAHAGRPAVADADGQDHGDADAAGRRAGCRSSRC